MTLYLLTLLVFVFWGVVVRSRHDGRVFAFVGDRRTGKSTLARKLALRDLTTDDGEPVPGMLGIYVTPNGEESDPWPGRSYTSDELARVLEDGDADIPPLIAVRGGPHAYQLAAELALDVSAKWRVTLIIDECHRVFREGFGDGTAMAELFHEGRHRGIDVYLITQWPARADKRLFRASDATWWFRLHAPEDLEWIAKRYSVEAATEVANLANYCSVQIVGDEPPAHWKWRADRAPPKERVADE